ncbi:MAG: hypothetical protein QM770_22475 [Tepidisphaeraceae bacterium]
MRGLLSGRGVRSAFVIASASVCVLAGARHASADTSWTGANSTDWFDAGNWNSGLPGSGNNDVLINNVGTSYPYPVLSAGTANSSRDIRIGTTSGGTGRLDQTGGTLNTGGGSWFWLGYVGANATYNLANTAATGGTYTGFGTGSGSLNIGGATQDGNLLAGLDGGTVATINVNTTGTIAGKGIFLGAAGASSGNMNVDNGTVNLSDALQVGATFFSQGAGTNTYKQSGGTVTANIVAFARGQQHLGLEGHRHTHRRNARLEAVVHARLRRVGQQRRDGQRCGHDRQRQHVGRRQP